MAISPVQQICPSTKWNIKCPYAMTPEFIVVHNTANDASALNEITYMNNNDAQVSYHFAVDDKEVRQGLPLNRNGWHAGDGANGKGNRKGIGIEICYSLSGGTRFTAAEKLAAKFIAQLLNERGWGMDKVTKHQDYSGKYCPHRTLDLGWDRFKGMVQTELNALKTPEIPKPEWIDQPKKSYMVMNDTNLVNVITGENVRAFTAGNCLDFVQYCVYNGNAYYRTEWSRDNKIDNGIPVSAVAEVVPDEEKIAWEQWDGDHEMITLRDCNVLDLKDGTIIKALTLGEIVKDLVEFTVHGGGTYLRTKQYKDKKKDYGIELSQLTTIDAPADVPEGPLDQPSGDIERPNEPIQGDPVYPNWFVQFLSAIIEFIKGLLGQKG